MMIRAWELPHACETAEIAGRLARLSPRQRRVLREYVWKVELGELTITDWLREEGCPISEGVWYRSGHKANYLHNADFQDALEAYKTVGTRWQLSEEARQVGRAHSALVQATPRAAERLIEHMGADQSQFWQIVEHWIEHPLPSHEILATRKVPHPTDPEILITEYRVRQACLDLKKMTDPRFARLVRKFKDSPRGGIELEFYDAQRAAESILDRADTGTAQKGQGTGAGVVVVLPNNGRETDRAAAGASDEVPDDAG